MQSSSDQADSAVSGIELKSPEASPADLFGPILPSAAQDCQWKLRAEHRQGEVLDVQREGFLRVILYHCLGRRAIANRCTRGRSLALFAQNKEL